MTENILVNTNNSIAKGTVIYEKGQPLQSVALVVRGRVALEGDGVRTTLGSGNFLGMYDAGNGKHSFTYTATDDCIIYGLPISDQKQACSLLDEKQQYRGLLITSINYLFQDIYRVYTKIKKEADDVVKFVHEVYEKYLQQAEKAGLVPEKMDKIEQEEMPAAEKQILPERLTYFIQCCRIPLEAQKNYYGASAYVAKSYYKEQCEALPELLALCRTSTELLKRYFNIMVMGEKSLFTVVGHMALGVKRAGQDVEQLSGMLDQILEHINDAETVLLESAGINMNLDRMRMEETYFALLSDDTGSPEATDESELRILDNSLGQILDYAPVHGSVVEEFEQSIEELKKLSDPFVKNSEVGVLRKKITKIYFELYEAIVRKSFDDPQPPMAVRLFLRYGYVSEKLLTEDELRTLLALPDSREEEMECRVYTFAEWLREIYEGRKNPSKSEFDMDYEETMRTQFREGKLTEDEYQDVLEDNEEKVRFEVTNLFRYANRILNGNITAFIPVLCSAGIFTKLDNSVVTAAAINQTVTKVEKIDYSIFYREHLIALEEVGLNHFEVTERITPEFILFPVYGRNGLMWQDLEGRNKSTHARILLPSFVEQDLPGVLVKMMAHYRWERCRTEMGAQWNNYRYPSLTSEYTDYLQFYKKNSDLSPERKEKVKAQLQQANNKHREVFTRDYQDWILREAEGAARLNRVAREILYTYCPFSDSKGKELLEQMAYKDAAKRYTRERANKEKTLTSTIRRFEKAAIDVPEEVEQTRKLILEL